MRDNLPGWTAWAVENWAEGKTFVEHSLAFNNDALHVMVGAVIQLAAALLLKVSVARFGPWAIVLLFEILNEASDLLMESWPSFPMQLGESGKDILLTMAIPTLLLFVARTRPNVLSGMERAVANRDMSDESPD